jgi:predicted exporter
MELHGGRGVRAVNTAEQVADEVLRVDALAAENEQRLRVIGVTWSDEAAAQAALLLEALTDAGFDNVVPVRLLEAVETLALAIAPVIGYEQTAVCVLEKDGTTVVMVDTHDGETQTATKHVRGGFDGLSHWLTGMFERTGWQPGGVVVVGAHIDIDAF